MLKTPTINQKQKKAIRKLEVKAAKFAAYVLLVVSAAYGVRHMLNELQEPVQNVITLTAVLALVFIITLNEE